MDYPKKKEKYTSPFCKNHWLSYGIIMKKQKKKKKKNKQKQNKTKEQTKTK